MVKIYIVLQCSDMTEGRGPMVPIAYFRNEEDATTYAKGRGVMGQGNGDVKIEFLHDSIEEVQLVKKQQLRERALNKLTAEEKKALDLT